MNTNPNHNEMKKAIFGNKGHIKHTNLQHTNYQITLVGDSVGVQRMKSVLSIIPL